MAFVSRHIQNQEIPMKSTSLNGLFACALALGCVGSGAQAAGYDLVVLPTLGGTAATATAINNAGAVVGASATSAGFTHATYWSATGLAVDLGTPTGGAQAVSGATDINASGQISGYSQVGFGGTNSVTHAIVWPGANAFPSYDLGSVDGLASASSSAFAINNAGKAVGYGGSADYFRAAHVWSGPADLAAIRVGWAAYGINNNNQIVGDTGAPNGAAQQVSVPALWTVNPNGSFTETVLGYLPGAPRGYASDINDAGVIIGSFFYTSGATRAARWDSSSATPVALALLGGGSSSAGGLNQAGQVVGSATAAAGNSVHAVLWQANGSVVDLNNEVDPALADGWVLTSASDINDFGVIVGTAQKNGETRAFVLSVSAVPEPTSAVLMLFGFVALVRLAKRSAVATN
jgi:probable HAF family extracellular repeat protein